APGNFTGTLTKVTDANGLVDFGTAESLRVDTAGINTVTASASGLADGTLQLTVDPATTDTAISASPPAGSVFGQSVSFTAMVTPQSPGEGTPTGDVVFKNGSTTLGTATLSGGQATFD